MLTIPNFQQAKILVIGDVMIDRYWYGSTLRVSPEAPVPVVNVKQIEERPGGAANVAANASALGATIELLGIIGNDKAGEILREKLQALSISHYLAIDKAIPTTTKLRVLSRNQQLIRLDFEEAQMQLNTSALLEEFRARIFNVDLVILSDYDKGVLFDPQPFIQIARQHKKTIVVDPKGNNFINRYHGATVLTPNRQEFESIVGRCQSESEIIEKGYQLLQDCELQALLITRGEQGMTLIQHDQQVIHLPTKAREVFDVTGAGDTVIAVLAASLAAESSIENAIGLANLAAGIAVTRMGAVSITLPELHAEIYQEEDSGLGIVNEEQLINICLAAKARGERLVMTNGCFDILHAGHVSYLRNAKALGDRLIVAINDDDAVKALKGSTRPINSLARRMAVLSGLESVDWVVPFSEMTPARLIEAVMPDVLVKGGDYQVHQIAGADAVLKNGGDVKILNFEMGISTTAMLEKILEQV